MQLSIIGGCPLWHVLYFTTTVFPIGNPEGAVIFNPDVNVFFVPFGNAISVLFGNMNEKFSPGFRIIPDPENVPFLYLVYVTFS